MSKQAVEWVIGKIVLDASFRETLIADPDQTLSCFDLNEIEKTYLKRIDLETMDSLAQTLALRVGKFNPEAKSPLSRLLTYGEDSS
jgi:hypothetical protein